MKLKCKTGEKITITKADNGVIIVCLPDNTFRHFVYWDDAKEFVKQLDLSAN